MGILAGLEPGKVFHFFEEIAGIPHGSGNMEQISDYLADFARARNLFYIQDEAKNIIIIKDATPGYEAEPTVILQGHMDMVAVKKPDCDIDMQTEGLRLAVSGDAIYAEGTSLGGDDGIAVAYALAILDSDEISHPRLEVIITVDEEVGLIGARVIDLSMLKGNRMVNLDSEEEGVFWTSCAGGAAVKCQIPVIQKAMDGVAFEIKVHGLLGGHSGAEIHKERGNSNCLMGRLLWKLSSEMPVVLQSIRGGLADNAIPRETSAVLVIGEKDKGLLCRIVAEEEQTWKTELATKDPGVGIILLEKESGTYQGISVEDTTKVAAALYAFPNGIQAMSADVPGLVETSLNMGLLFTETKEAAGPQGAAQDSGLVVAVFSVRSSVESEKYALIQKIKAVMALADGNVIVEGEYPGWQYRVDSPLRDKMVAVYRRMYGKEPKVEAIHAGLECGILGSKIEDLDCVSLGPDMKDIHTTEETLSISSVARVWDYLVELLATKD